MKRFVEGQDRRQLILLPDCLDDCVGEDNPVRIVDAFIDELDLAVLGFDGVVPEVTGRPAYHPSTLLKIYLYGYLNRVQSSRRLVDAEHHLIVAHEVTNQGYDRHQLAPMALKARQATGCEQVTALADRGYFSGDQVLSCEGTGVAPIVPKTLTSSGTKRGLFTRQDFIYDAEHDHYTCPAGAKLTKIHRRADHTEDFDRYRHLSLLHLSAQTPVHADPAADHQALGE